MKDKLATKITSVYNQILKDVSWEDNPLGSKEGLALELTKLWYNHYSSTLARRQFSKDETKSREALLELKIKAKKEGLDPENIW